MANEEQLALLKKGVNAWNAWREKNQEVKMDLSEANLCGADLRRAHLDSTNLSEANLRGADLSRADLTRADLKGAQLNEADLSGADLRWAHLSWTNFRKANLRAADLRETDFRKAHLREADLRGAYLYKANFSEARLDKADLSGAHLNEADLSGADLSGADLSEVGLRKANLTEANLTGASLEAAQLIETNLERAILTSCHIHGVSAWKLKLEGAQQFDLIITPYGESIITVDDLEVAQFIYLLLYNEKIRQAIDTITSKVVLILGRFTPERKAVLDQLRDELRKRNYLPIVFDFDKPASEDLTGTVATLAHMARFIIADLTDPNSIPYELGTVVPGTVVPVQPILLKGQREFPMFINLRERYHWVLETYRYSSSKLLIAHLAEKVIGPAEAKARELRVGGSR